MVRHGPYSTFEMVSRAATLFANLKEDSDGYLVRSEVYDGLDPSEKAATSYFIGLVMTKLFAEFYLDVPWLMHLDVYRRRVKAELAGRSRPDLLGQNSTGTWFVLESKGRTGLRDRSALAQAKSQARQIVSIGGETPHLRVGLLAHFTNGRLEVEWEDPEREGQEEAVTVDLSSSELLDGYYRPFEAMFDDFVDELEYREVEERRFRTLRLEDADLAVGLYDVRDSREKAAPEGRAAPDTVHGEETFAIGGDGILVELGESWTVPNMREEPQSRTVGRT